MRAAARRVALDVTPLQNAHRDRGIGTYVRGLATRLLRQRDIPLEIWGWRNPPLELDVAPPHVGRWLWRPPMPAYRGAWAFASAAASLHARASSAGAVHITDPDALTRLRSRFLMATVYDLIPLEGLRRRQLVTWVGYRRYLKALTHVDLYFAISEVTRDELFHRLGVDIHRIAVVPPGVEQLQEESAAAAAAGRPYFLFVGGPNPNKNLATLLDAMSRAIELPEELLIAGPWLPRQVAALERRVDSDPGLKSRVRHLGFVDRSALPDLMRRATALIVPSFAEGFGLPVAEGLAAGAAVAHSGIRVLDDVSRGAAAAFDPKSADDIAARLRELSRDSDQRSRLRKLGLARAQHITWDAAAQVTLEQYESVLSRGDSHLKTRV